MTRRKTALCALVLAQLLLVSGCVGNQPVEKASTNLTLPEARPGPDAPTGDSQTPRSISAVLYVPTSDASYLNAEVESVTIESGQTKQEAYVAALLQQIEDSDFYTGSQQIRLAQVSNAVETSRDLVTVNLHTSVRAITSPEAQFALRVAITNTLTELPETNYVNVLVNGRDIGLDVGETIPTGVMSRYLGSDISSYWNQLRTQRTVTEGDLQKTVALYFISEDGTAMLAEVRNMTFSGRDAAVYALELVQELRKGSTRIENARELIPPDDWFERNPVVTEIDGDMFIELHFFQGITDFLRLKGSTLEMLLSSICYTLTGFIPKLEGIVAYIDGELVTEMSLMNGEDLVMPDGKITREDVSSLAADECTVYFPLEGGNGLYAVQRPIAQRLRTQPRALLQELMQAPRGVPLSPALPETVTDADILGLQIQGDTALINVTEAFAEACQSMSGVEERNMVYAIVNTLTEIEGVTRVRFYVEGEQLPLAGTLFMGGEFMRNPGLIYAGSLSSQ